MATVEKVPMLAEGYEKLLKRAEAPEGSERPEIVEAIEEARAHGDLSENAEYHAAKERQGQVEAKIADLEDKLARAESSIRRRLSGDKIVFGATVRLLDEDDKPVRYQIVGQTEADAKVGRISYNSPLGRALIGRKVGEEVEVHPLGRPQLPDRRRRIPIDTPAAGAEMKPFKPPTAHATRVILIACVGLQLARHRRWAPVSTRRSPWPPGWCRPG